MRLLTLIIPLLTISCDKEAPATAQARPGDLAQEKMTENLKRDATACAKALIDQDFEGMIRYMPAKLSKMMGGAAGIRKAVGAAMVDKEGNGMQILNSTVGDPGPVKMDGDRLFGLVPQRTVVKVSDGLLTGNGWLLGISDDGGQNWVFIDTAKMRDESFARNFPELVGKVKIPKADPPSFKKD